MRRWSFLLYALALVTHGCNLFGGLRLNEVATASGKPSNVAAMVSVTRSGQPVTGLGIGAFRLSEDGQPLAPDQVDLRLLDPAMVAAFHTVLLVDLGHASSDDKRRQLSRAAAAFVRKVRQKQVVTVLAFDGSPRTRLVGDFTVEVNGTGPEQLENLMMMVPSDPSRNLHGAVTAALDALDSRLERSGRSIRLGTLVVFSRGPDVAGRVRANDLDERLSHTEHQLVYVNVTGDPTSAQTSRLTTRGKIEAEASDTLPIAFEQAAQLANKLANQFYLLSYCSPARAGERRLRIEVEVNDEDGDAHTDAIDTHFDATGFSPSCNAQTPPRFTLALRASSDRNAATPPKTAATNSTASETPTTTDDPIEPDSEIEVPPPKNRGYAP